MNFFRNHKNSIVIFLLTIVFILLMITSSSGKPNAGIVSNTVGTILKPFRVAGTYVSNCLKYAANADKFETENTLLKQQIINMTQKDADYDNLSEENAKLRAMLELSKTSKDYKLIAANVISTDTQNWTSSLTIDKGLKDGINKNDAVITEIGLVGYVSEVGRNWANVVTILDTSCSVGAIVERIEEYCIIQGDVSLIDKNLCAIKYLTTDTAVSVGDVVITSGSGGVYPAGVSIGKISEIKPNSNGVSRDAVIAPMVDFSDIGEIFVVTK